MGGPGRRRWLLLLSALLAAGAAARWRRLDVAWSYWAVDYVANVFPLRDDLTAGLLSWTRPVGLHPPQHGLLTAAILAAGGSFGTLYGLALLSSAGTAAVGAAWLARSAGPGAAAVFLAAAALSPHAVHYGLELNNYPLHALGAVVATAGFAAAWADPSRGAPAAARTKPRRGAFAAVGGGALVALHGHVLAVPLVAAGLVAAAAGRRWRLSAVLAGALLLAAPVLAKVSAAAGGLGAAGGLAVGGFAAGGLAAGAFAARLADVAGELRGAWVGRFGPAWALGCLQTATLAAAVVALRAPSTRLPATVCAAAGAVGALSVAAAMVAGAASPWQTPYWLQPAWCGLALLALGVQAAGPRARAGILLVAAPWAAASLAWQATPALRVAPAADPTPLTAWLDEEVAAGDVVLYAWEAGFLNDDPRAADPLLAALRPSELGDFTPRADPLPAWCHRWRTATACFANRLPRAEEEEPAPAEAAVAAWLAAGRTVHIVLAWTDPARPPPALDRLAGSGDVERRDLGGTAVLRIRPPLDVLDIDNKRHGAHPDRGAK